MTAQGSQMILNRDTFGVIFFHLKTFSRVDLFSFLIGYLSKVFWIPFPHFKEIHIYGKIVLVLPRPYFFPFSTEFRFNGFL